MPPTPPKKFLRAPTTQTVNNSPAGGRALRQRRPVRLAVARVAFSARVSRLVQQRRPVTDIDGGCGVGGLQPAAVVVAERRRATAVLLSTPPPTVGWALGISAVVAVAVFSRRYGCANRAGRGIGDRHLRGAKRRGSGRFETADRVASRSATHSRARKNGDTGKPKTRTRETVGLSGGRPLTAYT